MGTFILNRIYFNLIPSEVFKFMFKIALKNLNEEKKNIFRSQCLTFPFYKQ